MARPIQFVAGMSPSGQPLWQNTWLESLNGINGQTYAQIFKNNIKDAEDHDRYDTLRIEEATSLTVGEKTLFNIPVGGRGATATGTAIDPKPLSDTNMVEGGRLEFGTYFLVEAIQVQLYLTNREYATITAGEPTDLTAEALADTIPASNVIAGLADSVFLSFTVGNDVKAEGPIAKFPCEYVLGGFAGAVNEGVVQIGNGFSRPLRQAVVIQPGQNFKVILNVMRTMVIPRSVQIRVYLTGVKLSDVG